MARLIRTEKEVEGRYEEVWIVVEEDSLDQWPAGPLEIVGRDALRVDGRERATGQAVYTADLAKPGMLHTAVLRSPHPRARVASIDLAPALAMPGVHAAIGPGDIEQLTADCSYQGEAIAAVCADTLAHARTALRAIECEFEVLEPLLDPDEAVRQGSLLGEARERSRGDYERGLAEADVVVEAEFRTQVVLHNSMETHQAVVEWIGDGVEVHISTQYIWGVRNAVAAQLGLPADKVRVVCQFMGGGFGSKNGPDDYTFIAAELAKRTHRPVKCALTRREENTAAGNRNATIQRLTVGARSDGTLTVLGGEFVNAVGWSGWSAGTEGPMQMLYACPNVKTITYGAKLNLPPMKAFRAPGFVEGTFGLEALLDELAAKLGVDPLELRRRNHTELDAAEERPYSGKNLLECYRRAEPHWERRHEVRARSTATVKRGVGMASQIWYGGGGPPSYAWIRVGSDGRATVVTAMQDIGTGTRTAMAQIAAEELGIPLEHVTVSLGDSDRGPYATLSAGSSTTPSVGPVLRGGGRRTGADRGDRGAARPEGCARRGGRRRPRGRADPRQGCARPEPDRHAGADVRRAGRGGRRGHRDGRGVGRADRRGPRRRPRDQPARRFEPDRGRHHPGDRPHALRGAAARSRNGAAADDVARRVQAADDRRRPGDHQRADRRAGRAPDEPRFKGVGEPPIIPTAAAIANAIRDATGADVRQLPISREEMLRALREAEARHKEKVGAPAGV